MTIIKSLVAMADVLLMIMLLYFSADIPTDDEKQKPALIGFNVMMIVYLLNALLICI